MPALDYEAQMVPKIAALTKACELYHARMSRPRLPLPDEDDAERFIFKV